MLMQDSYIELATCNREALEAHPGYCVCCLGKVVQVRRWISDEGGDTAICPHCGIDAVVPAALIKDGGSAARRLCILRHWQKIGFGTVGSKEPLRIRPEHSWFATSGPAKSRQPDTPNKPAKS